MSEPALKCENNAILNQNCILKLFIAFKMAYYCCASKVGSIDFLYFLQKSFIPSTTGMMSDNQPQCVLPLAGGFVVPFQHVRLYEAHHHAGHGKPGGAPQEHAQLRAPL